MFPRPLGEGRCEGIYETIRSQSEPADATSLLVMIMDIIISFTKNPTPGRDALSRTTFLVVRFKKNLSPTPSQWAREQADLALLGDVEPIANRCTSTYSLMHSLPKPPSHHGVASLNNKLLIIRSQSDNPSPKPDLFQPDRNERWPVGMNGRRLRSYCRISHKFVCSTSRQSV